MSSVQAQLTYFGHSAVLLTTEQGKKILIDPWLEGNPLCPDQCKDPGPIDYICLTHGHSDHSGSATTIAKKYGSVIFANWEICSLLVKEGIPEENVERMNIGGTVRRENLAVTLTPAIHSSSYEVDDGQGGVIAHYAGLAAGIVIHLESGRTVYHAGDTALFGDMKLIGEAYRPVLALLPIGDRLTMGPREAAIAASLIGSKQIIPIHHSTFDGLTGKPEMFEKELKSRSPESRSIPLAPGESVTF